MTATELAAADILGQHRPALEDALRRATGDGPSALERAARYVMGWEDEEGRPSEAGGKRLRPLLCLLAAEAVGGSADAAMPGAVAVELIHNFSLVHDDIQDRDSERHGRPTAWALWGEAQAINLGDFLYTRALRAFLAHPERKTHSFGIELLTDATERMIQGQWQDLSFEGRDDATPQEYIRMVEGKTSALLGAAIELGATLGGAPPQTARSLRRWGELIGGAFQIRDDILGIWGDPAEMGKPTTSDVARRKKSLPIVLALGDPDAGAVVRAVYAQPQPNADEVNLVVSALAQAEIRERCESMAAEVQAEAENALRRSSLPAEWKERFEVVGRYLVDRTA